MGVICRRLLASKCVFGQHFTFGVFPIVSTFNFSFLESRSDGLSSLVACPLVGITVGWPNQDWQTLILTVLNLVTLLQHLLRVLDSKNTWSQDWRFTCSVADSWHSSLDNWSTLHQMLSQASDERLIMAWNNLGLKLNLHLYSASFTSSSFFCLVYSSFTSFCHAKHHDEWEFSSHHLKSPVHYAISL